MAIRDTGRAPPHTDYVGFVIRQKGYWEVREAHAVAQLAGHEGLPAGGGHFIDVGAHAGWYSFLFAFHGYAVLAIEPSARNRLAMRATLCMNPLIAPRVTIVPHALGAERAPRRCALRTWNNADGNGVLDCDVDSTSPCGTGARARCSGPACVCEPVTTSTLNRVIQTHLADGPSWRSSAVVAKLDVEGNECAVLRGGSLLFTKLKADYIQYEGLRANTTACMKRHAARYGYRIGTARGQDQNTVMYKS